MTQNNTIDNVEVKQDYYKSGALCYETPYVNGKIHGIVRVYEEDKSNIDCLALYDRGHEIASVKSNIKGGHSDTK